MVDVGAGTGLGTRVIARTLPGTEILAVEPHRAMRTALLAVVAPEENMRASGPDTVTGTMAYRVDEDGAEIATLRAEDLWYVLSADDLAAEVGRHGLRAAPFRTAGDDPGHHGIQVVTRQ